MQLHRKPAPLLLENPSRLQLLPPTSNSPRAVKAPLAALWTEIYPWIIAGFGGFIGCALLLPTKLGEAVIQFRTNKLLAFPKG